VVVRHPYCSQPPHWTTIAVMSSWMLVSVSSDPWLKDLAPERFATTAAKNPNLNVELRWHDGYDHTLAFFVAVRRSCLLQCNVCPNCSDGWLRRSATRLAAVGFHADVVCAKLQTFVDDHIKHHARFLLNADKHESDDAAEELVQQAGRSYCTVS
jgi:hypothetical protein